MLSEKTAKEAKPTDKPQKLPHEKGLYLYISPKGCKSWRYDYRFADKLKSVQKNTFDEVAKTWHDSKAGASKGLLAPSLMACL